MGRGLGDWDVGLGTRGRRDSGTRGDPRAWDVGTGGRNKQTPSEVCAEFVKYNSRRSSER